MPRPCRCRRVCSEPLVDVFGPASEPDAGGVPPVVLLVEEYEALRIVDYEGRTHEQCAAQMRVSRTTVTEIYERARHKVADAIVNGRTLVIRGGNYEVCGGACARDCAGRCRWKYGELALAMQNLTGDEIMRIAIPVKNENIYQHFGMASTFKVYDVEEKRVVNTFLIEAAGTGHGAKVGPLVDNKVDCVICGGIGEGAMSQLAGAGIFLIAGISGNADEAVAAALAQTLKADYQAAAAKSRHQYRHQHGRGGEGCGCGGHGEGGCGCGGHGHGEGGCGCGGHGHGEGECGCGGHGHGHGEGECGCGGHGHGEGHGEGCGCGGHGHGQGRGRGQGGGCGCGRHGA